MCLYILTTTLYLSRSYHVLTVLSENHLHWAKSSNTTIGMLDVIRYDKHDFFKVKRSYIIITKANLGLDQLQVVTDNGANASGGEPTRNMKVQREDRLSVSTSSTRRVQHNVYD